MNEPRRLLEGGGDEFQIALLNSTSRDEVSERGRARVAAALGLAGIAVATTAAAAGATAGAKTSFAGITVWTWVGLGALAIAAAFGAARVLGSSGARSAELHARVARVVVETSGALSVEVAAQAESETGADSAAVPFHELPEVTAAAPGLAAVLLG